MNIFAISLSKPHCKKREILFTMHVSDDKAESVINFVNSVNRKFIDIGNPNRLNWSLLNPNILIVKDVDEIDVDEFCKGFVDKIGMG